MSYCVLHTEKITSNPYGLGQHCDREELDANYSIKENINSELSHLNKSYTPKELEGLNITDAVNQNIENHKTNKRKIGKNQVRSFQLILSGSHEKMKELEQKGEIENWYKDNIQFLKDEFGEKNLVKVWMHRDEKTPHIHAILTPITSDGRLSAKELMGNRVVFKERQDRYARAMGKYGLERGLENSPAKHEDINDYYREKQREKLILEQRNLALKSEQDDLHRELDEIGEKIKAKNKISAVVKGTSEMFGYRKKTQEQEKKIDELENVAKHWFKQNKKKDEEYKKLYNTAVKLKNNNQSLSQKLEESENKVKEYKEKEDKRIGREILEREKNRKLSSQLYDRGRTDALKEINENISKSTTKRFVYDTQEDKIRFLEKSKIEEIRKERQERKKGYGMGM